MGRFLVVNIGKNKIKINEFDNIVKAERFAEDSIYFEGGRVVLCKILSEWIGGAENEKI